MTLAEHVAAARRTLNRLMTSRLARRTTRPLVQLRALRSISLGQVQTQGDLALRLLVDAAAVSRMVARLEDDGLVERRPGEDRRCVHLALTRAGKAEARILDREIEELDREVHRHLTAEEVKAFVRIIEKLRAGLLEGGAFGDPKPCASGRARRRSAHHSSPG